MAFIVLLNDSTSLMVQSVRIYSARATPTSKQTETCRCHG